MELNILQSRNFDSPTIWSFEPDDMSLTRSHFLFGSFRMFQWILIQMVNRKLDFYWPTPQPYIVTSVTKKRQLVINTQTPSKVQHLLNLLDQFPLTMQLNSIPRPIYTILKYSNGPTLIALIRGEVYSRRKSNSLPLPSCGMASQAALISLIACCNLELEVEDSSQW